MHVKIVLAVILSFSAFAVDIDVRYKQMSYKLKFDEDKIIYKDEFTDLSLVKKECNKYVLSDAHKNIKKVLEMESLAKNPNTALQIVINGNKTFEDELSYRGVFFINFRKYFTSLKIEEDLNCAKR